MMPILIAALLLASPVQASTTDRAKVAEIGGGTTEAAVARLAALYDEVCLRTFPIDTEVDALMARKKATRLTPDEVKVTFNDDPGRGWLVDDGDRRIQVMLELPPFHACSVRRSVAEGPIDLTAYRAVATPFKADHRGFAPGKPMDADMKDIHMHLEQEARDLPGGSVETLMVIDQHVIDPAKRARGETAINLRFVHQITTRP